VLQLSAGLPAGGAWTYRITNSLATFGGTNSLLDTLNTTLVGELALYSTQTSPTAERTALSNFFDQLFTDVATGTTGVTSGTTLTDSSVDFVASGVLSGQIVYIRSGGARGIYQVQNVFAHSLTVDVAFPVGMSGVSYRVDKFFGVSVQAMRDVFAILADADDFVGPTQTFQTLVATPFPVMRSGVSDLTAFARGVTGSDLTARAASVTARVGAVGAPGTGYTATLSSILGGSEHLYDQRYTWIDGRIDLKTGILVKKQRAIDSRVQAQADVVNQLFKLLAVQGG
jgi:hypothetical protein